jgi:L-rhamnose-H+ transport protein
MSPTTGFALIILGGAMQGTYFLLMKYVEPWKWENIWLLFAGLALVVLPVGLAIGTVPGLGQVFTLAPGPAVLKVFLYGTGWGIGAVLSGLGVARMGMAMGVAVLIGVTAAIGSLVPLVVSTPELILQKKGILVVGSVATLLGGVILVAVAGKKRDASRQGGPTKPQAVVEGSFGAGLAICIFSGIFSSMLNLAFAFSRGVSKAAVESGASESGALNAVWMIALVGGFIANGIYTAYLLTRNRTWRNYFFPRTAAFWFYGLGMALLWYGGLILYGRGAATLGVLGSVIGWPLFMAAMILSSSLWGFATGEWKGTSAHARRLMLGGFGVLMLASAILGLANSF